MNYVPEGVGQDYLKDNLGDMNDGSLVNVIRLPYDPRIRNMLVRPVLPFKQHDYVERTQKEAMLRKLEVRKRQQRIAD